MPRFHQAHISIGQEVRNKGLDKSLAEITDFCRQIDHVQCVWHWTKQKTDMVFCCASPWALQSSNPDIQLIVLLCFCLQTWTIILRYFGTTPSSFYCNRFNDITFSCPNFKRLPYLYYNWISDYKSYKMRACFVIRFDLGIGKEKARQCTVKLRTDKNI